VTAFPLRCANCLITIRWWPTIVDDKIYCCAGCADGGPCTCDYDRLPGWAENCPIVLRVAQELTYRTEIKNWEEP
jgi:hypothetical protein